MSIAAFLAQLRERGIELRIDGEELRCSAPPGTLSTALREELRRRKSEIVAFIRSAHALTDQPRAIVPLQRSGKRVPVFAVPGHNGDVFCYSALAQALGPDQPFYGLQPPGVDGAAEPLKSVDELAAYFAAQIAAFRPGGPLIVAGFCAGGTIAFELARRLAAAGRPVDFVTLFGSPYPAYFGLLPRLKEGLARRAVDVQRHLLALSSVTWREGLKYFAVKLRERKLREQPRQDPALLLRAKVENATLAAIRRYSPPYYPGRLVIMVPSHSWALSNLAFRWRSTAGRVEEYFGPTGCDNDNMLRPPHAPAFAELFRCACDGPPTDSATLHRVTLWRWALRSAP